MSYKILESIAEKIWDDIEEYHRLQYQYDENAITSFVLREIARSGSKNVLVPIDTRPDESTKGCDFELWVGSDSTGWYRYAVQAKRVDVATGNYPSLAHVVGTTKVRQIAVLQRYSSSNKITPLYCFYNYVPGNVRSWSCPLPQATKQLGVSITSTAVVRKALSTYGARNFDFIHDEADTVPWRCLLRCPKENPAFVPFGSTKSPKFGSRFRYDKLPSALRTLPDNPTVALATLLQSGYFDRDTELYPGYISVLDISGQS
ncbi:DUF6615 family protein [Ralstonia pseudosolanacearum]